MSEKKNRASCPPLSVRLSQEEREQLADVVSHKTKEVRLLKKQLIEQEEELMNVFGEKWETMVRNTDEKHRN